MWLSINYRKPVKTDWSIDILFSFFLFKCYFNSLNCNALCIAHKIIVTQYIAYAYIFDHPKF